MKVKVPSVWKFLAHPYTIKISEHLWHNEQLAGSVNHRTNEITLDASLSKGELASTLNHEVLEAIAHKMRLDISHDDLERIAQGFTDFQVNGLGIELDWSNIKEE